MNSGADLGWHRMLSIDLPPNQHQDQQNNEQKEQDEADDAGCKQRQQSDLIYIL